MLPCADSHTLHEVRAKGEGLYEAVRNIASASRRADERNRKSLVVSVWFSNDLRPVSDLSVFLLADTKIFTGPLYRV